MEAPRIKAPRKKALRLGRLEWGAENGGPTGGGAENGGTEGVCIEGWRAPGAFGKVIEGTPTVQAWGARSRGHALWGDRWQRKMPQGQTAKNWQNQKQNYFQHVLIMYIRRVGFRLQVLARKSWMCCGRAACCVERHNTLDQVVDCLFQRAIFERLSWDIMHCCRRQVGEQVR